MLEEVGAICGQVFIERAKSATNPDGLTRLGSADSQLKFRAANGEQTGNSLRRDVIEKVCHLMFLSL